MIKSVSMDENGETSIIETEKPNLEVGSVLVKTLFSEVCGTDVHLMHQRLKGVPYPIIPGHVSTGIVEEIKGDVFDIDGKKILINDKITFLDVHETCNACWFCLVAKETTRCPKRKVYGITYSAKDGLLGGWSQYIYLKPGVKIIKLPNELEPRTFMAAGCGLPTAIHAVERAEIKFGDSVIVQGSGPVGLMAAILSKLNGAFEVIMIGGPKHRLEIAKQFGIDVTINIDELEHNERLKKILEITENRGADVVIEATGSPIAVKEGMTLTRDGGTYVIVGQYTDAGDVKINPHNDINKKHLTIKGSWGSDFSHFYKGVKFMNKFRDKYPWDKIITSEFSLSQADEALRKVEKWEVMKAIINPNL